MYIKKVKKPNAKKPQTIKQKVAAKKKAKQTEWIVDILKRYNRNEVIAILKKWGGTRLTGFQCLTLLYDYEANLKLDGGVSANDALVPHGIKKTKMDELKKKSDKRMKRK